MGGTVVSATVLLVTVAGTPALAQINEAEAARILFASQDVNGDGVIDIGEFEGFRRQTMAAMDADGDARIDRAEWTVFDPGFLKLAQRNQTVATLEDAKGELFAALDSSGDGYMSNDEMTAGMLRDFLKADENDDGRLSEPEMTLLPIIIALRAAIMK